MADVKLYLSDMEARRKKMRQRLRLAALFVVMCILIALPLWIVFQSSVFAIQRIQVAGADRTAPEAISGAVRAAVADAFVARILGTNNMLAWPDTVPEDALSALPNIKDVIIRKNYRARTITLSVVEREPYGIWCVRKTEPARCFWFEADGRIFQSAPEGQGKLIHVVTDYTRDSIEPGTQVLPESMIPNLIAILEIVARSDFVAKEIRYERPELQEVRVPTYDGPVLYFSLRFRPDFTAPVLAALYSKDRSGQLSPRLSQFQYVDFRVENRAYYK